MELRRYLRILRRGWVIITVCLLAGAALAGLYVALAPRTYTATTPLLLTAGPTGSIKDLDQAQEFLSDTAVSFAPVITSPVVLGPTAARLGLPDGALPARVSASVQQSSTVIDIVATGSDPVAIARVANATAASAVETLPRLQLNSRGLPVYELNQLGPAVPPVLPSAPRPQRAFAVGIILGIFIGVGSTMILQKFDDRIHRPAELEVLSGLPVLAVIPRARRRSGSTDPAIDDGYRRVRTALLHGAGSERPDVLFCTPRDDGSTLALGVARTLSEIDRRVVLVDGLEGGSAASRTLGSTSAPGLLEALDSPTTVPGSVQPTLEEGLRVLAHGDVGTYRAGLRDPRALVTVIERLARSCDHVVLVAPPLLRDDNGARLVASSGLYVLSIEAGRTRAAELTRALGLLGEGPGTLLGVVLTGARISDGTRHRPRAKKISPKVRRMTFASNQRDQFSM